MKFGSIIAADRGITRRTAASTEYFVARCARHRAGVVSDLRAPAADPRYACGTDGAQRRLPDRTVLSVGLASARNRQSADPLSGRVRHCRDHRAVPVLSLI